MVNRDSIQGGRIYTAFRENPARAAEEAKWNPDKKATDDFKALEDRLSTIDSSNYEKPSNRVIHIWREIEKAAIIAK